MKIVLQLLALAGGLFSIALAFSLGNIDSLIIDFTQLPEDQLSVYQYVFFMVGLALWLAVPVISE